MAKTYTDEWGVIYSANKKKLLKFPVNFKGQYTIPEGVTTIVDGAFEGCRHLKKLFIPVSMQEVDYNAFYNCRNCLIMIPKEDTERISELAGIKHYVDDYDTIIWTGDFWADAKTTLDSKLGFAIFTIIAFVVIYILSFSIWISIILAPIVAIALMFFSFVKKWLEEYYG